MTGMESARLERIYAEVQALTARLDTVHAGRLQCGRGCSSCCVDGITVFEVEARNIRRRHAALLNRDSPHPLGACAFLDGEGACRIYEHRPYVCRTQGYPLRWLDELDDGTPVERRDICPLNEAGDPVEGLPEEACWSIGPVEGKLAALQQAAFGSLDRVALRGLFGGERARGEAGPQALPE